MKKFHTLSSQRGHVHYIVPLLVVVLIAFVGARVYLSRSHALNGQSATAPCTVSANLVNSCRPWVGAAVEGYPQVASDSKSQFLYAEQRDKRTLDIFHDYHPSGSLPLNSTEQYFAKRANTYIYVNWKPASNWAQAGGSNATVNANIDKAAASIKSVAPHKIFLTVWHEPENDVSGGTSCPTKPGATGGTPAQYKAMWANVENRFKAAGVTNVVWTMNYMGYYKWDCLVPQVWPGNNLVDWVTYDSYSSGDSSTVANTIGRVYNLLVADNSATDNFESKPWGLGEWGDCNTSDQAHVYAYDDQMKAALDAGTYPRLKMYMVYDDNGNNAGMGCLTDYSKAGKVDPTEQSHFNNFVNDSILTASKTTTPPHPPAGDTTPPSVAISSPANGASVKGVVVIGVKASDNTGVKEVKLTANGKIIRDATAQNAYGWGSRWGSQKVVNGSYTITATAYDAAGNHSSSSIVVNAKN